MTKLHIINQKEQKSGVRLLYTVKLLDFDNIDNPRSFTTKPRSVLWGLDLVFKLLCDW